MKITQETIIKHSKSITVYILSILYIIIGVKHFLNPDFFIAIMPPFIPFHKACVFISGFFEILFGILILFKNTRHIGAWGIITLLIIVFPANIYLYLSEIPREALNISKTQALIRMPFQIPLIIIAYWHSIEKEKILFSYICLILFIPTIVYFINL